MDMETTIDIPKNAAKAIRKVQDLLTEDEKIEYVAVQKTTASFSPDCAAATNKRLIFCRPKQFGLSMNFEDYLWKEIADCHLQEGILGAEFAIVTTIGMRNKLSRIPKSQARKLYRIAQLREEEMQEYRRQRALEDKRAAAGGVTVHAAKATEETAALDPQQQLINLKQMLDSALITQEEFDAKRAQILDRI